MRIKILKSGSFQVYFRHCRQYDELSSCSTTVNKYKPAIMTDAAVEKVLFLLLLELPGYSWMRVMVLHAYSYTFFTTGYKL